ncbi:hypothetical protein Acr_24g0010450 [Actinidia rufa]|uniref:Uncharacterized protein n=1 Tax=Actinidia rufa TaxID=165716 RepID=A0A7J0GVH7_9ERIC|nr:hypothetical protein Acr_24g0010450 [Actinidia rufa]
MGADEGVQTVVGIEKDNKVVSDDSSDDNASLVNLSDDEKKIEYPVFVKERDMKSPRLVVGMIFPNAKIKGRLQLLALETRKGKAVASSTHNKGKYVVVADGHKGKAVVAGTQEGSMKLTRLGSGMFRTRQKSGRLAVTEASSGASCGTKGQVPIVKRCPKNSSGLGTNSRANNLVS